jgi:hypothetical protein
MGLRASVSASRSLLFIAIEGCSGGGSNPTCIVWERNGGLNGGRVLSGGGLGASNPGILRDCVNGGVSIDGLDELLGGLLNGETSSSIFLCSWFSSGAFGTGREGIAGFSARLTAGGTSAGAEADGDGWAATLATSLSLLSSVERRGGGGDGGFDERTGDLRDSTLGLCDLLGGFGVTDGLALDEVAGAMVAWLSAGGSPANVLIDGFAGDCGGCIMNEGGRTGLGLRGDGAARGTSLFDTA